MAREKKSDLRHLLSAGCIVVAVVGILFLGWALQSDPSQRADQVVIEGSMPDHQFPEPLAPEKPESGGKEPARPEAQPIPAERSEPAFPAAPPAESAAFSGDPRERARQDRQRMRVAGDGYTLQFATLCSPESVSTSLKTMSADERFYLLEITSQGRPCYRLCWGIFATREEALAARGIPRTLTNIESSPLARPLDKVIQ